MEDSSQPDSALGASTSVSVQSLDSSLSEADQFELLRASHEPLMDDARVLRNLIIVAALVALLVAVLKTTDPTSALLTGLLGNLPSSLIAVILGIPIALQLSRMQEARSIRSERAVTRDHASHRRSQVLEMLQAELSSAENRLSQHCAEVIDPTTGNSDANRRTVLLPMLSDQFWRAIAQSGDLQFIDDPNLLNTLGTAYHFIAEEKRLEETFYVNHSFVGMRTSQASKAALIAVDPLALRAVTMARAALESESLRK